jgi:N-acyl-phosphatidylethanolamine-hydrolysing phospholipase D
MPPSMGNGLADDPFRAASTSDGESIAAGTGSYACGVRVIPLWRMTIRRLIRPLALGLALALPSGCLGANIISRSTAAAFRTPQPAPVHTSPVVVPEARLAATWIGHATVLVQMDDKMILTDPVFTDFVGGVSRRLVKPGLRIDELPPLAGVVVSHRHFDHLSSASLEAIGARTPAILVPEGAGTDVPRGPYRVQELAWWTSWTDGALTITSVPVQHVGGRVLDDGSHARSFTGYVFEYHDMVVYFGGDTAYAPDRFRATAARFSSIDLALLPICPIAPRGFMRPTHVDPFEALEAARDLGAKAMIPVHYDTFVNSYDEPGDCLRELERVLAGADSPFPSSRVYPLRIGEQTVLRWRPDETN